MIAVIFEVEPKENAMQIYLDHASQLKDLLEQVDGFISVERFESLTQPGKLLSLSFFRDEEAVTAWRQNERHKTAQIAGRSALFANYRLRVASVIRDYGLEDREMVPEN